MSQTRGRKHWIRNVVRPTCVCEVDQYLCKSLYRHAYVLVGGHEDNVVALHGIVVFHGRRVQVVIRLECRSRCDVWMKICLIYLVVELRDLVIDTTCIIDRARDVEDRLLILWLLRLI